ncbi:MAG: hypothetical protein A2252_04705 [Elusimicrobia bacterium RIFOXYA2_FULL_39_19]|nr:MAG: hypothetical protein A2252_04705 [Elusimicrobia bacterium RIFOXYA2_FULL_39_19]
MLKRIALFMVSLCFVASVLQAQDSSAGVTKGAIVATIKVVMGNVKVLPNGEKKKIDAKETMLLSPGDVVETSGKSYATLIMANGAQIKINEKTKMNIEMPVGSEEAGSRVNVKVGQIWAKIISGRQFYVKTPTAVCSIRGTELDVKVDESGQSEVMVFEGIVEVKNDYGVVQVNKEEKTVLKPNVAPQAPVMVDVTKVEKWQEVIVSKEEKKEEKKVEKKKEEKAKEEKKEEKKEKKEEVKKEKTAEVPTEVPQEVIPEPIQPVVPEASPSVPR